MEGELVQVDSDEPWDRTNNLNIINVPDAIRGMSAIKSHFVRTPRLGASAIGVPDKFLPI